MTVSPPAEPTVADTVAIWGELSTIVVAIAAVFVLLGVILFAAMLLRASRYPWPVPIIAPLAMLTLVFGLTGIVLNELVPLAGAGLGALAGVLTSQLGKPAEPPAVDELDG